MPRKPGRVRRPTPSASGRGAFRRRRRRRPPIDDDLLLDCFGRLEGRTDAAGENFRYVLALLLMRRKRFKFEETRNDDGRELLVLRCGRTGAAT